MENLSEKIRQFFDLLIFSSIWILGVAGALSWAASLAMEIEPSFFVVGIAMLGSLVIYNLDRLWDLNRDRLSSPDRSAFITRHFALLFYVTVIAGACSFGLLFFLPLKAILLLVVVFIVGVGHPYLKRFLFFKEAYITLTWVSVVVFLPAFSSVKPAHLGWVLTVIGLPIFANIIASNIRDAEAGVSLLSREFTLYFTRLLAIVGIICGVLGPEVVFSLTAVPLATLLSLIWFRDDERYGLLFIDGSLLVGGLIAVLF